MAMRRWEPTGISRLRDEMDRLFQDFMRPLWAEREEAEIPGYRMPAVDLAETNDEYMLKAELPGVSKENLNVEVMPDMISIKAEISEERETGKGSFHRRERVYNSFRRVIPLPTEVKAEEAKANFKDGLLEIHLPKAQPSQAKPVKVEVG